MIAEQAHTSTLNKVRSKIKDFALLVKFRLSALVVISAVLSFYFMGGTNTTHLWFLILGGFLITAASNATNQIIERNIDSLMTRTAGRPLARGSMGVLEAWVIVLLTGVGGLTLLYLINPLTGVLGFLSYFMYVALYTPLKRVTPWAVFVGAFPGAIPAMAGAVAVTGTFTFEAGLLFFVQFIWQFPHFWAIAWVVNDDYAKGGFRMLPSKGGKNNVSAFLILSYSIFMVFVGLLPWAFELTGILSLVLGSIIGCAFFVLAYQFFRSMSDKDARLVMFASFFYLPLMQLLYVIDKI